MTNFAYISGNPDNLTGGGAANMVDIQGPLVDLATWLNTDLQPRVAAAVPTFVTSLPVSATDGQEIYYQADATNGIIWHLRYNAGSASSFKWEFVGGAPFVSASQTATSTTGTGASYSPTLNDGTGVVGVTVPLAGDYVASAHVSAFAASLVGSGVGVGTAAVASVAPFVVGSSGGYGSGSLTARMNGLTANVKIQLYYLYASVVVNYANRDLTVLPVRVG